MNASSCDKRAKVIPRAYTTQRDERRTHVLMRSSEASAGSKPVRGFTAPSEKHRESLLSRSSSESVAKVIPRAFTLTELLVVIAIIGTLAAIILVSLGNAQKSARDAKRVGDLDQVVRALEMYRTANNDAYPPLGGATFGCASPNCLSGLTDDLVPNYLSSIAIDPTQGNTTSGYRYCRPDAPKNTDQYQIIRIQEGGTGATCTVRGTAPITGSGTTCWTVNGTPDFPYCDE